MEEEKNNPINELKKNKNRKQYMREYYLKKRHQMINGKFHKDNKANKKDKNSFSIKHGEFVVSFK